MYRPENWRNPYGEYRRGFYDEFQAEETARHDGFEEGADAMLEAIRGEIDVRDTEAYGSQCGCCHFLWDEEELNELDD